MGVSSEVIDLKILTQPDITNIISSVEKTRRLIVIEPYSRNAGVGSAVMADVFQQKQLDLLSPPRLLTPPFTPVPTANSLTEAYYNPVRSQTIVSIASEMLGINFRRQPEEFVEVHLPPRNKLGPNWEIL
jgi:pyruvate dehydrogenase E1 component beta subunit